MYRHLIRRHALRLPLAVAALAVLAVAVGAALRTGVALGATHAALGDSLDPGFNASRLSPTLALVIVLALAGAGIVSTTLWHLARGRREPARVTVRARDERFPGDRRG
jgi:hypothetical protein